MSTLSEQQIEGRDLRQRELVPPQRLAMCQGLVIGVGAIGRQVALQLAALGLPALHLVDHDHVAVENLASQGYLPADIGQCKVEATAHWCSQINPQMHVHPHPHRFRRSVLGEMDLQRQVAVFCCVDRMEARRNGWEAVRSTAHFFADGRMAAEVVRVLCSEQPLLDSRYLGTLFAQDQAYLGSCTARSTIYSASIAAGMMLSQFTRWLRQLPVDHDVMLNLLASELTVA
jgi:molybdopterin-synthase adenylyltransferase